MPTREIHVAPIEFFGVAQKSEANGDLTTRAGGSGVYLGKLLPKVRVVRAFNSVNFRLLASDRFDIGTPVFNKSMTAAELRKALVLSDPTPD